MTRRGKWEYHYVTISDGRRIGAWQYDNQDFWLRLKTGLKGFCQYNWNYPYRWWYIHTTKPETWIIKQRPGWVGYWNTGGWIPYGICSHKHYLPEAMKMAEDYLGRQVLKALGGK